MTVELIAIGHSLATFRVTIDVTIDLVIEALESFYKLHPGIHNLIWILEAGSMMGMSFDDARRIVDYIKENQESPEIGKTLFVFSHVFESVMGETFYRLP